MSLRDDLLAKAQELIDDKAPDWLDKLETRARDELPEVTAKANELLAPLGATVTADQAGQVLDELAKAKAPLARVGSKAFAWVVANLEDGDAHAARLTYLREAASFEERREAMQLAGDQAFQWAKESRDAWNELAAVLEAVGQVGLKILVAVARKAVGI